MDENGLIGMNISTQLTLPNGGLTANTVPIPGGGSIDLPDFFVRTTRTRVSLRDGQTVAIDGLIDKEASTVINQVPFLSKIPFFSMFFKSHADNNTNEEVIVLVTPHIVRMRDPDSARYPEADLAGDAGHGARAGVTFRSSSRCVTMRRPSTSVLKRPRT